MVEKGAEALFQIVLVLVLKALNSMLEPMFALLTIQSSLLQCLLRELPAMSGSVTLRGSVAYASQESWVYSATIRENVLFGLSYRADWYNTVMEACALDKVHVFLLVAIFVIFTLCVPSKGYPVVG